MKEQFRQNIIDLANLQLEKPYVWGATGPDEFDCSGLTYYLYKTLFDLDINISGYGIGDTTKQMTNNIGTLREYNENDANKEKYLKDLKKGDLIFFHRQSLDENKPTPSNKYPGHVGIYLGNSLFLHASSIKEKVAIDTLDGYWLKVCVASRDIISGIIP